MGREWYYPAAVFIALVALYAYTAPRTVAFEDDGGFIMAANFLGLAHPPGYPLYTLIAKASTWLPFGSIAYRVHLLSGLLGAATCVVIWWIGRTLARDPLVAAVAALAYGVSPLMWSQSIIAEVYTLNTLLFFSLFALALQMLHQGRTTLLPVMGFVWGLSFCNHVPLTILGTPCLVFLLWPLRWEVLRRLPLALVGVALGLLPYLWMFLRSRAEPEISFYGPIRSFDEFLHFVSRKGYAKLDNVPTAGWDDKLQFAIFHAKETLVQLTPVGAGVALLGFIRLLRSVRLGFNLAMLAGFVSGGLLVVLLAWREYQYIEAVIFHVYPLVSYGFLAIWFGLGLAWLREFTSHRLARGGGLGLGLAIVVGLLMLHWPENDRHDETFADDYARGVLESLPQDAILFADTDADAFPMGYLNLVEGVRPDVDLFHFEGMIFSTRLLHALDGNPVTRMESVREFLRTTQRPTFFMIRRDLGYGVEDFGLYSRVDRTRPPRTIRSRVDPGLLDLVLRLNDESDLSDPWTRVKREAILANFAGVLVRTMEEQPDDPRNERYRAALDAITSLFLPAFSRVMVEVELGARDEAELLEELKVIEGRMGALTTQDYRARYYTLRGRLQVALGHESEAGQDFAAALTIHPDPGNPALLELLGHYVRTGQLDAYRGLRDRLVGSLRSPELISLDRRARY